MTTQPDAMTPDEFKAIRAQLGATQVALATFLGYGSKVRVSEFERGARAIPDHLARLMVTYRDGYRPQIWPFIG